MTDSAHVQIKQDEEEQEDEQPNTQITTRHHRRRRLCDFCGESTALLYCRADSAKLCLSCDKQVHSTNQLFTKHLRTLLCDACDASPASILCSTEHSVLCQNCDWERHSVSPTSLHERRPLEGFNGCPSVSELLGFAGFRDLTKKELICGGGWGDGGDWVGSGDFGSGDVYSDFLVWDTPSIVTFDDLIVSNSNSEHSFQAMGVPPLPKDRKAACGQYKEEILNQLRGMAKSEPGFSDSQGDIEPFMPFQSAVPKQDLQPGNMYAGFEHNSELLATVPPFKAGAFQWRSDNIELTNHGLPSKLVGSYVEENFLVPDKDSDVGGSASYANCGHEGQSHQGVDTEPVQVIPKVVVRELTSQERDSAISRYKEKKKTRRYEKHIRYESRKVRAESRTRIKGRFAKMDQ